MQVIEFESLEGPSETRGHYVVINAKSAPGTRALLSQMQPTAAAAYQPLQMKNAVNNLVDVMSDPDNHVGHARR